MKMTISKWWKAERKGRVEEGTSQDYCPTNGGAILYVLFWCSFPVVLLIVAKG